MNKMSIVQKEAVFFKLCNFNKNNLLLHKETM